MLGGGRGWGSQNERQCREWLAELVAGVHQAGRYSVTVSQVSGTGTAGTISGQQPHTYYNYNIGDQDTDNNRHGTTVPRLPGPRGQREKCRRVNNSTNVCVVLY